MFAVFRGACRQIYLVISLCICKRVNKIMVMLVRPFEVLCKIDDAVKNEISMGCYARFEEY